jgi:hypothetical protein
MVVTRMGGGAINTCGIFDGKTFVESDELGD